MYRLHRSRPSRIFRNGDFTIKLRCRHTCVTELVQNCSARQLSTARRQSQFRSVVMSLPLLQTSFKTCATDRVSMPPLHVKPLQGSNAGPCFHHRPVSEVMACPLCHGLPQVKMRRSGSGFATSIPKGDYAVQGFIYNIR